MEIVKDMAGWRTILLDWKEIAIHIFPKEDRIWGFEKDWYDGPYHLFGFGFLLLITWSNK